MDFGNLPLEMRNLPQWVCWKYEDRGDAKLSKVPYNAKMGTYANVNAVETWSSFQVCANALPNYNGLGFVLHSSDPYTIVDLDHTDDPNLIQKQIEIHNKLDSYSEVSPSGKGLHIVVNANVKRSRRSGPFEFYSSARFMTFTGNVYNNKPVMFRQAELNTIYQDFGFDLPRVNTKDLDFAATASDYDVYQTASNAKNGQKFLDLWNGDTHTWHFGDHSRADFALIDILTFYSKNREQINRMFLMSGLGQRKKANRKDYVDNMVSRSFDNITPDIDFSNLALPQVTVPTPHPATAVKEVRVKGSSHTIIREEKDERTYIEGGPLSVPPGIVGEIATFIYQQSYKPVVEIAITAAIGLMAGYCGKAYNVSNTGLNMYLLLLAGTGRGKEEMAKGASKLNNAVQRICPSISQFEGPGDMASGQGLLRYVSDHPTGCFISILGEFGIKLKQISKPNAMGCDLMLQRVLLDLYAKSGATDKLLPTAYSDAERNTKTINSPAISIIGDSVPNWFFDNIDEAMIGSGLLTRFTVIEYLGRRVRSNYAASEVNPSSDLVEKIATLISITQGFLLANQRYHIPLDKDANQLSIALDRRADDEINSTVGVSAELWNRVHLKTLRCAGLIAVGKNPYNPIIDAESWLWAERFIVSSATALKDRFDAGSIGSTSEEIQLNQLTEVIEEYKVFMPKHDSVTHDMYVKRIIPLAYLSYILRGKPAFKNDRMGAANAVKKSVQIMIDSGELSTLPKLQSQQMFGRGAIMYHIDY